jgi:hypothetical protein
VDITGDSKVARIFLMCLTVCFLATAEREGFPSWICDVWYSHQFLLFIQWKILSVVTETLTAISFMLTLQQLYIC